MKKDTKNTKDRADKFTWKEGDIKVVGKIPAEPKKKKNA